MFFINFSRTFYIFFTAKEHHSFLLKLHYSNRGYAHQRETRLAPNDNGFGDRFSAAIKCYTVGSFQSLRLRTLVYIVYLRF